MRATTLGPPGRGLLQVAAAVLRGGRGPESWPQLPRRDTVLTHQGRGAIGLACGLLGLRPRDEVLMPAWNCGTEIDAVRAAGPAVVLYRVDGGARIDAADLRRRVTHRTRVVYAIHYFGWPQPLAALRAFCRERGLVLVEDCALALFSSGDDGPLGRDADAAIFSFPKSLPVPDGGALVLRDAGLRGLPALAPPSRLRVMRRTLGLVKRRLGLVAPRADRAPPTAGRPDIPPGYYWDERTARWSISRTTLGFLDQIDAADVVARRRANYARLRARVADAPGVAPLFDALPEGVCPLEFPVLVRGRDAWVAALRARGVAAVAWWAGYHRALPWDEFPDACRLKDGLLALPVNQDLDATSIDRIAAEVQRVARSAAT